MMPSLSTPHRCRRSALAGACLAATLLVLSGCGAPPRQAAEVLYRLPLEATGAGAPQAAERGATDQPRENTAALRIVIEDVRLPVYLDRDRLLLPVGDTGATPASHARWAEPLRDAVPRLLRHDLALRLGTDHVAGPAVPPGFAPTHRLRLEVDAFDITPDRQAVRLAARWWLLPAASEPVRRVVGVPSDPAADRPAPVAATGAWTVAAASSSAEDLVKAHRLALRRLADDIGLRAATPTPQR